MIRTRRLMALREQKKLFCLVKEWLATLRATRCESLFYQYTLNTPVGVLHVSCSEGNIGSIFTRFDQPQRARTKTNCNPNSGKWNFHFGKGYRAERAFREFKNAIEGLWE
jgi:hypothetical protein